MTETPTVSAPRTATITEFDPTSTQDVHAVTALYRDYLLEEHDRTGEAALGLPVAAFLRTLLVQIDGHTIGLCSIDTQRHAVELLYLAPDYRSHGLGHDLLAWLAASCPEPMRAKAPLSPSGWALVHKLGIQPTEPGDEEERAAAQSLDRLHHEIHATCRHKRTGNPARPCPRCYRKHLSAAARGVVLTYTAVAGAVAALPNSPLAPVVTHPMSIERRAA